MGLTNREKIAHLFRRFGFGASKSDLDKFERLGLDAAIDYLIDYEKVDEEFTAPAWQFCFEDGKEDVYLDPFRPLAWWSARLVLSQRPLQEKLTLFWHDHFAVSATKVEFGPSMLEYMEALRKHASGSFEELLCAVSKTPAMILWLDTNSSFKGAPNENFARELLELFTMGVGNYTEADIKEAARAFTGWGLRYLIYEQGGEKVQEVARESIKNDRPMIAFCIAPDLHDSGMKSVLGKTANFDGDALLSYVAQRPETAKYICTKLWEFFAYPKPEPAVVERLSKAFVQSNLQIKPVLREIVQSPEFWSDQCHRALVKSPADFVIPIVRQLEARPFLLASITSKDPMVPAAKALRDTAGLVVGTMNGEGMLLLYPPNVGGWEWGTAWITSNNMLQRIKMADLLMGIGTADHPIAGLVALKVTGEFKPRDSAGAVEGLLSLFDGELPESKRAVLVEAFDKAGGVGSLAKPETAAPSIAAVLRLLFASPEFNMM